MDLQLKTLSQLKAIRATLCAELKALDEHADECGIPLIHQEDHILGQLADIQDAIEQQMENPFAV
jgi:hypothetical protein